MFYNRLLLFHPFQGYFLANILQLPDKFRFVRYIASSNLHKMNTILLFTDGSVDTQSGTGCGAYLAVTGSEFSLEELKKQVKTRKFENTSSVRLELETLLWALDEVADGFNKIKVYTDSQNIVALPSRRGKLEKNNFRSKKGRLLKNHDLYRDFFNRMDELDCELEKVTGHQPGRKKDRIHRLFTLVDKASRKALRKEVKKG